MKKVSLEKLFEKPLSGEWGIEDNGKGIATPVIRTANFLNSGKLNLDNIVYREIDKTKYDSKLLKFGDIIIEKSGGSPNQPVGRVVYFDIVEKEYFTNNFTSILRPKSDNNSKYVFYLMRHLYDTKKVLKFQNQTTGIINLKLSDYLKQTVVKLSSNINEQNKIVNILDKLDNKILLRQEQLKELSNVIKSRFYEMFGEIRTFESIDKIFEIIDGDRGKNYPKSEDFFEDGHCLFLNTKNVTKKGFSFQTLQFITEMRDNLLRKGKLERHDIVFTTRGTVGNVAYYDETIPFEHLRINSGMVILRKNRIKCNSRFMIYVLQNEINYNREISGTAQPQLPVSKLKKIVLPLPPLALQNQFADFVAEVDKSQLAGQMVLKLWRKLLKFSIIKLSFYEK